MGAARQVQTAPSSPVAQTSSGPRLDHKAPDGDPQDLHDPYDPFQEEQVPSAGFSPELLGPRCDVKGAVIVKQSEGAASVSAPLVSREFDHCAALIVRNMKTGRTLVMHHDSGTRAQWPSDHNGDRPVSPATPRRGLIGRDRFGFEAFMKEPGEKCVLLLESEQGYDRREVVQQLVARGVRELKPLTLELGSDPADAQWHMTYRPETDTLIVHLEEVLQSAVLHYRGLFTSPEFVSRPDGKDGKQPLDIVDGLQFYRDQCARTVLNDGTRAIVNACLDFVQLRNVNPELALKALSRLVSLPGVPMDLLGSQVVHPLNKDSPIIGILTRLVDKCLSLTAGSGLVDAD